MKLGKRGLAAAALAAALAATYAATSVNTASAHSDDGKDHRNPVEVEVFAPGNGDNAGIGGAGWIVDLDVDFRGSDLAATGFNGLQLTGPAGHNNVPPLPGTFSTGKDDKMPGLVVMTSTTNDTLPRFSGPGTNLANLFNLTGVTDRSKKGTELWDTWIVGTPIAGKNVDTVLTVAVIADLNHDGIYNDAPDVVTDRNRDGRIDRRDLEAIGVASNIQTVRFHINGDTA